ncbi:MAG: hypothetical protein P1U87_18125 [Verrucomicrobiales bacterium]|nr:hypothetical protein [Verrucomicrobiales bacterium]
MGTSTNYSGSPNWGPTKSEVTRAAGEGNTSEEKSASIVAGVVETMATAKDLGFGAKISEEGGRGTDEQGHSKRKRGGGGGGAGGATGGASRRSAVRSVAQGLGSFLSEVREKGFSAALRDRGLTDLSGKDSQEVVLELADLLGGPASLIDETAVRNALMELMLEWAKSDEPNELEENIQIASENIGDVLHDFFAKYIFEVFKTVGVQNVVKAHGPDRAEAMTAQIKSFIEAKVDSLHEERDLTGIDWTGDEGAMVVDEIVEHTIEVFGSEES